MNAHVILDPARAFDALVQALAPLGWRVVDQASGSILPGEPEHALFERGVQHLAYSFNPVCHLRLLEVPIGVDDPTLMALPAARKEAVAGWLESGDERELLRGVLAARHLPHANLLSRVEALRNHPQTAIAKAAEQSGQAIRAALDRDHQFQSSALAAIEALKEQLAPLLQSLGSDQSGQVIAALRPRDEDYGRAFMPEVAQSARQAYEALWKTPPPAAGGAPGARLKMHVAPAGMLAYENELSQGFPSGYRAIAALLDPHRVWVAWKLVPPGQDTGMAYDGLVWLDDHWAWFPKPYRVLAPLVK